MIRSFLLGAVAGARAMTPLAAISVAASRDWLPADNGAPEWLGHPAMVAATLALAVAEMGGDKLASAPDRIAGAGLVARLATGAIAGAAVAPRSDRIAGAAVGVAAAFAASYLTFGLRKRALREFDPTKSGIVEDALAAGAAALIVGP